MASLPLAPSSFLLQSLKDCFDRGDAICRVLWFYIVITGRSSNLFRATISAVNGRNPPSVSAQPTERLSKTEKFSLHFLIFLCALFSFKRKRKFFCFDILLIAEWRRHFPPQALLRRAGGAEGGSGGNSAPPFPASFSPPLLGVPTSLARHFQLLSYLK